ncbi:MAG TPA: class I SAM-dependent methyltransferase [Terriglobia bacterium]|nr:class I SAM-dependent methyltransferase [Terriglobia bacterium]
MMSKGAREAAEGAKTAVAIPDEQSRQPCQGGCSAAMQDSVERFTSRVENYVKYRPHYPRAILQMLATECGLTPESRIADVGAGPGQLAELFLENGNLVYAIEPNPAMREAAEQALAGYPNARILAGTAEATPLPDHSVDFVTAGQAFHWFDRARARSEFARILKPAGWVVIVWNQRETATPLMAAYEALVRRYSPDYEKVDHRLITADILREFFGPQGCQKKNFPNFQDFDYAGLEGRLLSSSYAPPPGDPAYGPMLAALRELFDAHQVNGRVRFDYTTCVYYGRLSS